MPHRRKRPSGPLRARAALSSGAGGRSSPVPCDPLLFPSILSGAATAFYTPACHDVHLLLHTYARSRFARDPYFFLLCISLVVGLVIGLVTKWRLITYLQLQIRGWLCARARGRGRGRVGGGGVYKSSRHAHESTSVSLFSEATHTPRARAREYGRLCPLLLRLLLPFAPRATTPRHRCVARASARFRLRPLRAPLQSGLLHLLAHADWYVDTTALFLFVVLRAEGAAGLWID